MMPGMLPQASDRSRPGIRFGAGSHPVPEPMPRMDVAAFIGFAERGPLNWPVAVEDMAQFANVFGATPQLGWGPKGERLLGNLAESVRSFFVQGGQRCWIVRVAGAGAHSNVFALPCLYKVAPSSGGHLVLPALAQARCEGSWSDLLHVATRLRTRHINLGNVSTLDSAQTWKLRTRSDTIRPGDLLRVVREADRKQVFFPISKVGRDTVSGETVLYAQSAVAFAKGDSATTMAPGSCGSWKQEAPGEPEEWKDGRASIVSIDLRVRDNKSSEWRAENLGLTPLHPRYCGALPTDIEVFGGDRSESGSARHTSSFGSGNVPAPWFPMAAKADSIESANGSFMVPLDMDGKFGEESAASANSFSSLERDGLLNFDSNMFLDPALVTTGLSDLMATADAIRYSAHQLGKRLTGIHAVLGWFDTKIQDEVTLIAVPDAVHPPWKGCPQSPRYMCLCEEVEPEKGKAGRPAPFACCSELAAPVKLEASITGKAGAPLHLTWETGGSESIAAIEFRVQESASGKFLPTDPQWQTNKPELDVETTGAGRRFFRVRAESGGATSVWSVTLEARVIERDAADETSSNPGDVTREIQRALIRLCAAQGEMFSVLSMPKNIDELDASNHIQALISTAACGPNARGVINDPEGRICSYASLYHPWIETRSADGGVRPVPPDGAILGMIAARTRERAAWAAPANRPLRGAAALHTALSQSRLMLLGNAGINIVMHRTEGFTLLSEDTLSTISELRPIHVRRLLILLRRLVSRLGEEFTFETNSPALRALIRQRCNSLLERMFRAGAFAGRSAAESFQVSIDDGDNPQASMDAGRLIIRIRVRPANALRFITVNFTLGGGATGVTEENQA